MQTLALLVQGVVGGLSLLLACLLPWTRGNCGDAMTWHPHSSGGSFIPILPDAWGWGEDEVPANSPKLSPLRVLSPSCFSLSVCSEGHVPCTAENMRIIHIIMVLGTRTPDPS